MTTPNTPQSGASNDAQNNAQSTSVFDIFINVGKAVAMLILLAIGGTFLYGMYNDNDKIVEVQPPATVKIVTVPEPAPTTQVVVEKAATAVPASTVIVEESVKVTFDDKDSQLPVEWRKIELAHYKGDAIYYLSWKNGKGTGPVGVRVLDWSRLPTPPDSNLVVKFADPRMIDDLGYDSRTLESLGNGMPVLTTN